MPGRRQRYARKAKICHQTKRRTRWLLWQYITSQRARPPSERLPESFGNYFLETLHFTLNCRQCTKDEIFPFFSRFAALPMLCSAFPQRTATKDRQFLNWNAPLPVRVCRAAHTFFKMRHGITTTKRRKRKSEKWHFLEWRFYTARVLSIKSRAGG